ncbi:MAG: hypothetical protein M3Z54_06805 [Gemmatimonadota bacterium]|nr:hypothetical protein [Gemmatimonadota bacterium]
MKRSALFVVSTIVTGISAAIGSMIGHFFGPHPGVMLGGVIGGLIGAALSARLAAQRGWVAREDLLLTILGTEVGFLAAALIATKTLSSPIGPVFSSLLIGIGAITGQLIASRKRGRNS